MTTTQKPKAPRKQTNAGGPGKTPARDKLDAVGIEVICERIEADESYQAIAKDLGVAINTLLGWIDADDERSARAKAAWIKSAASCDVKAEAALSAISDDAKQGEITRQRELASHYRWRAKVRDRKVYGDSVNLDGEIGIKALTDEQLLAKAGRLADKLVLSGVALPIVNKLDLLTDDDAA